MQPARASARLPDIPGRPGQLVLDRLAEVPAGAALLAIAHGADPLHLVGGAVRDLLLDRIPRSLDVVVEGDASALAREFAERLGGDLVVHERFDTATVRYGGTWLDLAAARAEEYDSPGALPRVRPATLAADLPRRDFTVNAMAVSLAPVRGAWHAVDGALEDLAAGRLAILHPASFRDDPTRLMRLGRYAGRLGFEVEPATLAAAREALADGALGTVSGSRIGSELRLALAEEDPVPALTVLDRLRVLAAVEPGLAWDQAAGDLVVALTPAGVRADLALMALLSLDVDPATLAARLDALEFPGSERDTVLDAVRHASRIAAALASADRPSALAAASRGRAPETIVLAGALGPVDQARRWLDDLRHVRLEISGDDVVAAGIAPGPEVGRRLAEALDRKLDGTATGREAELAAALRG
jgi:tRNA nucleotidyltransferase (CCA-adding enzyme)